MEPNTKSPHAKRPKASHPFPNLRQCIFSLKNLSQDPANQRPRDQGELFATSIAFLCHLKADQAVLHKASCITIRESEDKSVCPPPEETPAIKALIEDKKLFQSILAMLRLKSPSDLDSLAPASTSGPPPSVLRTPQPSSAILKMKTPQQQHAHQRANRKRAASVSLNENGSEAPSKMAKVHHSPAGGVLERTNDKQKRSIPEMNLPILAATIFYSAFQHVDHWPVSLVQAFAEDSFGPRRWVDDKRCSLLTENLALALDSAAQEEVSDAAILEEAEKIADFYDSTFSTTNQREAAPFSPMKNVPSSASRPLLPVAQKSSSFDVESKHGDSSSDSGDEECVLEASVAAATKASSALHNKLTPKSFTPSTESGKAKDGGESSSSGEEEGEEEVLVAETGLSSNLMPKRSDSRQLSSSSLDFEATSTDAPPDSSSMASSPPASPVPPQPNRTTHPLRQERLNLSRIRPRYLGSNLDRAHVVIVKALSLRLDSKTKQNSGLLSALPVFTSIPGVRRLVTCHLERWLQSPALSGLARTLFSATVSHLRNVDPPLADDVKAIDSILTMKLKANQVAAHIENITSIVKTIPTWSISRQIFLHLLREELADIDKETSSSGSNSDHIRMFVAVHSSLPPALAADALASAVLALATSSSNELSSPSTTVTSERSQLLHSSCILLRRIAGVLGRSYDGCLLVKSFVHSVRTESETIELIGDEEKARLVFECMLLMVPHSLVESAPSSMHRLHPKGPRNIGIQQVVADSRTESLVRSMSTEEGAIFSRDLLSTRKLVLEWCCSTLVASEQKREKRVENENREERRRRQRPGRAAATIVGAGIPDFTSVLDGHQRPEDCEPESEPSFSTLRCLLFLAGPQSPELVAFLCPNDHSKSADSIPQETQHRVYICREFGADVDNEMLWIILKSAALPDKGISSSNALSLIEHLFDSCQRGRAASLLLTDSSIVWALYHLVEYDPPASNTESSGSDVDAGGEHENKPSFGRDDNTIGTCVSGTHETKTKEAMLSNGSEHSKRQPKLAHPGMWWRATALALAMCGLSPQSIGAKMWKEHPTLQALMKMTTSGKYRFPTADSDEAQRESMKNAEAVMREQESKIAELLFLPKPAVKKKKPPVVSLTSTSGGSRISARQRQKQAKLLALQREKEAAEALAEAHRRKKLIRAAQKTIMILDPRGVARKPPRESVNLILSVDELFGLSAAFQQCSDPDFLLATIGQTTRGSIERAYDWLIPIISSHPGIIKRLPASASCFLLLRAYGADGDDKNQLLELSAPLLRHVSDCLTGTFGETDALRAADLLLVDVADRSPDRRRCARRVLQEALSRIDVSDDSSEVDLDSGDCGWIFALLHVKHASALVAKAFDYVSHALAYERGRVLRAFVLALHRYVAFAQEKGLEGSWNFVSTLCELLSIRPHICCSAMDRFSDFRDLALRTVHQEFEVVLSRDMHEGEEESSTAVKLISYQHSPSQHDGTQVSKREAIVPLPLLRAALVLVSNWQGNEDTTSLGCSLGDTKEKQAGPEDAVRSLVEYLITIPKVKVSEEGDADGPAALAGATGATFARSGKRAVSVDQWVMLAKSRCDSIARHAALSAPDIFLPRLLLCSGLPRSSLITMIDRLGGMGDVSPEASRCYSQLLSPSATVEWGLGPLGRREIARKLLGRLSAYLSSEKIGGEVEKYSPTFLMWVSQECQRHEKSRKNRLRKGGTSTGGGKSVSPEPLQSSSATRSTLSTIVEQTFSSKTIDGSELLEEDDVTDSLFVSGDIVPPKEQQSDGRISKDFIKLCCEEGRFLLLEERFERLQFVNDRGSDGSSTVEVGSNREDFAFNLLQIYSRSQDKSEAFIGFIAKWVPLLTQGCGTISLWEALFGAELFANRRFAELLLSRCASLWLQDHTSACQAWILAQAKRNRGNCDLCWPLMLRFLVVSSEQQSVHWKSFGNVHSVDTTFLCGNSQENVAAALWIALECSNLSNSGDGHSEGQATGAISSGLPHESLEESRNLLSDWLVLILLIAQCGKKQMDSVTKYILNLLPADGRRGRVLPAVLLRLYTYFPSMMGLGDAKLRGTLLEAAGLFASEWLAWRSPLDQQVDEMIANLSNNPHQRLLSAVAELSKRHPLIIARKFVALAMTLEDDGAAVHRANGSEKRGRVHGKNVHGFALAKVDGVAVKVSVRHWGYSFTEPLWMSVLEVLLSVPSEVLFSCGLRMGLLRLFSVYMKLIYVQRDIKQHDNTMKMRGKLGSLLASFKVSNEAAYKEWLDSKIAGLRTWGPAREIVLKCDIDNGETVKAA